MSTASNPVAALPLKRGRPFGYRQRVVGHCVICWAELRRKSKNGACGSCNRKYQTTMRYRRKSGSNLPHVSFLRYFQEREAVTGVGVQVIITERAFKYRKHVYARTFHGITPLQAARVIEEAMNRRGASSQKVDTGLETVA